MDEDATRELADKLRVACNSYSTDAKALAKKLIKLHPTIQQSIIRYLVNTMIEMGKASEYTDLRNEASIAFCQRLAQLVDAENIHLPMI